MWTINLGKCNCQVTDIFKTDKTKLHRIDENDAQERKQDSAQ